VISRFFTIYRRLITFSVPVIYRVFIHPDASTFNRGRTYKKYVAINALSRYDARQGKTFLGKGG
jgi:hypothetical protein